MRLWHYELVKVLPDMQLKGLHRECCALRGNGWGRKQSVVNYVWKHPYSMLYWYHMAVMDAIVDRDLSRLDVKWRAPQYRGQYTNFPDGLDQSPFTAFTATGPSERYPEHDALFLDADLLNLCGKNAHLVMDLEPLWCLRILETYQLPALHVYIKWLAQPSIEFPKELAA